MPGQYVFFGGMSSTMESEWWWEYARFVLRILAGVLGQTFESLDNVHNRWLLFPDYNAAWVQYHSRQGPAIWEEQGLWEEIKQLPYTSSYSGNRRELEVHRDQLDRVLAWLDVGNVVVVGNSNGAIPATEFALERAAAGLRTALVLLSGVPLASQHEELLRYQEQGLIVSCICVGTQEQYFGGHEAILSLRPFLEDHARRITFDGGHGCETEWWNIEGVSLQLRDFLTAFYGL